MIRSVQSFCLVALACAALSACSSYQGTAPAPTESYRSQPVPAAGINQTIVNTAMSAVGSPYRYGGRGPNAFDCSGLVVYSYQAAGVKVPRTSALQFKAATPVDIDAARPGDLLFFSYSRKTSHVGIYLGNQQFVHAPSSGGNVSVQSLQQAHYREHFVGAGRLY
ncbi:MAG: C40 family peptidase [Gammaproteobacteria bacterium]|jgi:cell wall-associated NlpC family hydrolase|nr:C40 family peptidase [Gammaproteobacteria bacterium]